MSFSRVLALLFAYFLGVAAYGKAAASHSTSGPVSVQGYTRSNGTYVAPYTRSAPNGTTADNYSTKGNVNPYTGESGTKNPSDAGALPNVAGSLSKDVNPSGVSSAPLADSVSSPVGDASLNGATPSAPSVQDLLTAIYGKVIALESRLAALESKQASDATALRQEVQSAFNVVGAELAAVKTGPSARQGEQKSVPSARVSPPSTSESVIDSSAPPPPVQQWWKVTTGMTRDQIVAILGKPREIRGTNWYYNGGGYVAFIDSGVAISWGGYNAK